MQSSELICAFCLSEETMFNLLYYIIAFFFELGTSQSILMIVLLCVHINTDTYLEI